MSQSLSTKEGFPLRREGQPVSLLLGRFLFVRKSFIRNIPFKDLLKEDSLYGGKASQSVFLKEGSFSEVNPS